MGRNSIFYFLVHYLMYYVDEYYSIDRMNTCNYLLCAKELLDNYYSFQQNYFSCLFEPVRF